MRHRFTLSSARWLVTALCLSVVLTGGHDHARAQNSASQPALMLVFDGSGSMWGDMPGARDSKFRFTRQSLLDALEGQDSAIALGLATFGQRSNGGCFAATVDVPPTQAGFSDVSAKLARFSPKGRGPIVLAVEKAAVALGKHNGPKRMLVVHDGPDNCKRDICSIASTIKRDLPGLVIDALTLAPKNIADASLSCLTDATGGTVYLANTAADIPSAIQSVIRASLSGQGRPAVPPVFKKEPDPPPKPTVPAASTITGLQLVAVLAGTETPLDAGIQWRIEPLNPPDGKPAAPRLLRQAQVSLPTKPGTYRVTVLSPMLTQSDVVTVEEGKATQVRLLLDAARLNISTSDVTAPPGIPEMTVAVAANSDDSASANNLYWSGPHREASALLLPPGTYKVTLRSGLFSRIEQVTAPRGKVLNLAFVARLGQLSLKRTGARNPDTPAYFKVEADDPSAPSGRRTIARTTASNASFILPAGTYYATLKSGEGTVQELVAVPPGKQLSREMSLKLMALTVSAQLGTQALTEKTPVKYSLWSKTALDKPLTVSRSLSPVFRLPPGAYRIESEIGRQNAKIVRDFDVTEGVSGKLALRHDAGRIKLGVGSAFAAPGRAIYWEIFDNTGQIVWRTFDDSPDLVLKSGTYKVVAASNRKRLERNITIRTGATDVQILSGR